MKKNTVPVVLCCGALLLSALGVSCATNAGGPVAAEPASAPADYLGPGTVLAALMWEDGGWSETAYYPARVLTEPSGATKNQYQVESLRGDSDVAVGAKGWTSDVVAKSHPAGAAELVVNKIVLAKFDTYGQFTDAELAKSTWVRAVVLGTDDLFKDIVRLGLFWDLSSGEPERIADIPLRNIRVSDDPDFGFKP